MIYDIWNPFNSIPKHKTMLSCCRQASSTVEAEAAEVLKQARQRQLQRVHGELMGSWIWRFPDMEVPQELDGFYVLMSGVEAC